MSLPITLGLHSGIGNLFWAEKKQIIKRYKEKTCHVIPINLQGIEFLHHQAHPKLKTMKIPRHASLRN